MLVSLLAYFFFMATVFTVVAALFVGLFDNSALEKGHRQYAGPTIVRAAKAPVVKDAPPAKDVSPVVSTANADTKKSKPRKPRVLARQRNNYAERGYGNALGYAEETGYGPRGPFSH